MTTEVLTPEQHREVAEGMARDLVRLFPELTVEIAGTWVWVSGDTKPRHQELKALGLRWSPKKQRWYHRGHGGANRRGMPWDYIRDKYGAERVNQERDEIASSAGRLF